MRAGLATFALSIALLAGPARADYCALVDQATADQAVALIQEAGAILDHDWVNRIDVQSVARRRDDRFFRVVVNGGLALDLAYTYIAGQDGYRHLGILVDCDPGDWPETLAATAFAPSPAAASSDPDPADRLLGLVGVPAITPWIRGAPMEEAGEIRLYEAPDFDALVVDVIGDWTDLPTREYDYEVPGAIVRGTRGDWYWIETQGSRGWLAPADAGPFHRYQDLVRDRLSYLAPAWDGRIYERPVAGAASQAIDPARRAHMGQDVPVEVLEARSVEGAVWFRVAISWPSFCAGDDPTTLARGWLRAYDGSGAPTVWFYSRGC